MQATLSHYRVLEQIGAGGMGVVYRAHDEHLDCDVALKVLTPGKLEDDAARKRFRKEALALSKLNHPNIAVIHDFDTQDGTDFLIEELIPGLSLNEMISGSLSEREIVVLGSQLCEGLAAAHEHGVIHRDLKPANVRVTCDARLKILDFGLAKILNQSVASETAVTASLTETQTICGTVPYMAPEQLLNEKLDARADIWAAGCVLYEMATGRPPFPGSGPALTDAILHEPPTAPSGLNHRISPGLEAIILKCLEKEPSLRYQSAREIVVDLHRLRSLSSSMAAQPRHVRTHSTVWGAVLVLTLSLALASVAVLRFARGRKAQESAFVSPSIAVLPFTDMSADKNQEYFSDGLAEELLDSLAKIPELRVAARTSSFRFKGQNAKLEDIGRELNVATVLEGSVRKEGSRVRISAQLVKVSDGFHLWSDTYDRELNDIFAVQAEIAQSVASSLKVTLLGARTPSSRGTNAEAYNAYLQAQYFRDRRTEDDLRKSIGYYEQAIHSSPGYALAWAGLAAARTFQVTIGYLPFDEGCGKAREAADRALKLDPSLADALVAMGNIKLLCNWGWTSADASYQRAAALEPGNVTVLEATARLVAAKGRFKDALALRRQVAELDPLNPAAHIRLGINAYRAGQMEEAVAAFKKALELNPNNPAVHNSLGAVYLEQAHPEKALAEMKQETVLGWRLQGLALAYEASGRKEESDSALAELIEKFQTNMAFQIAEVYACRGEPDRAFAWLDRAYVQHDTGLIGIKGDPLLKSLERDPRYASILNKMGLPT